jgi:alanine dehydrogenase
MADPCAYDEKFGALLRKIRKNSKISKPIAQKARYRVATKLSGLRSRRMKIGVPKEIKTLEFRVGMTPSGVGELVHDGHEVFVETNAGLGIGMTDTDYKDAGATVLRTAQEVFDVAEMIVKVKEPQLKECQMLRPDQVLFTYLHLAADRAQTEALLKSGTTAIAYETVTAADRSLPLLVPMSEVAGRLSIQCGAFALQKANGGRGVLLGGVPGVEPAKVVVCFLVLLPRVQNF